MRSALKIFLLVPMALGLAAPATSNSSDGVTLSERQQNILDVRLKGRVPGKPVSCLTRWNRQYMSVISDDIILFGKGRNAKTIYVNKPHGGCSGAKNNVLVTKSSFSQLCEGEIAQVKDSMSGSFRGSCSWSEFVPYTKKDS